MTILTSFRSAHRVAVRSAPLALLLAATPAAALDAVKLQPHRAIYDLTLHRSASGSGLNEMNGRLVYELIGAPCEGYTQTMRFVTRSTTSDGSQQLNDIRTSSFEEPTGEKLEFSTTHMHDNQTEVTEGRAARREPPRGAVAVELRQPDTRRLDLPAGIYFPIQHSLALIEAARRGDRQFAADLYDGSERGDRVSATTTIIGQRKAAAAEELPATAATRMTGATYWPIATSYFHKTTSFGRSDAVPSYEMSARFFENGVSTRLVLDYGDFALKGDLKDITFLPETTCAVR
jgi:hypothetical protein